MSLRPRTADAMVGALVLGAIGIVLAALVVTRGWTERRVIINMVTPIVNDIKQETPVLLQGLAIGEVKDISPLPDTGARMGPPMFVVSLRLRERYANGLPIRLPLGTRAEITSTGLIGSASISLIVPVNQIQAALQPGDTIKGSLTQGWTDVVKEVADTLRTQVSGILSDTRTLLGSLNRTAKATEDEVHRTAPEIRQTLASARAALDRLEPLLARATTTLANADTNFAGIHDSLTVLMADTRQLINHADTLTRNINNLTGDVGPDVRQTLKTMRVVSAKFEYFIDQVSRRPHRLLTGVHQISRDSLLEQTSP
jgi:ABC-type transporter Mla subunit MlaD